MLPLLLTLACSEPQPAVAVVEQALPAVVLLVNDRPDGTPAVGTGVVMDEDGLVLTSLSVVGEAESVRAMPHAPDRTTYTPMDGGLDRFLFEHEAELLPTVLVRCDSSLDLAVVRVHADTSRLHTLLPAAEPVAVGDPVYALGHPHASIWSFTSGMVSAVHSGTIQHDAAINPGSAGGPLVDAQGRLVGIHTRQSEATTEGMAFAIPASLALRVVDEADDSLQIDLSSPDGAALSCLRAQELASASVLECLDWEHRWQVLRGTAQSMDTEGLFPAGSVTRTMDRAGGRAFWIGRMQEDLLGYVRPERDEAWSQRTLGWEVPPELARRAGVQPEALARAKERARAELVQRSQGLLARMDEENHLHTDASSGVTVQALLKAGVRAERLHPVSQGRVWVELVGRNTDGSPFRWSELYRLDGEAWRGVDPPLASDLAALPEGWAPPFGDLGLSRAKGRAFLLEWVVWEQATPEERATASESGPPSPP